MSRSNVIELKDVQKNFTVGKEEIEILKDVNLNITAGEYVILFGPSGCGKSTLLNVVSGLECPTKGNVLVRGESLYKKKQKEITEYRRSKIGIVFQQFNLLKALTIQENVALPMAAGGEKYSRRMERAAHLLDLVGLKKYLKQHPAELSGGQQQRVAIARALSTNPWILICDEPTGNLDSKSADEVMEIISTLNSKSKRTVILVTHNPDYLQYPHRVIYLRDGMIVKEQKNRANEVQEHQDEHKDVDFKDIIKERNTQPQKDEKDEKEEKEDKK